MRDGGTNVAVPILVGKNTGTTSYKGYDEITIEPQKGMIDAFQDWAYYVTPIAVSDQEESENMGKEQIVDLVQGKIMQAQNSLLDTLSDHLWASAAGNGGKDIASFPEMITTSESANAYMGVTNASWTNKYNATATSELAEGFPILFRKLKDGGTSPDMIITSDDGEADYEELLASQDGVDVGIRYASNDKGDIGYGMLSYKGIPIIVDKHVPNFGSDSSTPNFWFLNTKYLGFRFKAISQTPFIPATNQIAKTAFLKATCQLVTDNRRRQGLLSCTTAN